MQIHKNIQESIPTQKILKLSQRDFQKVSQWYKLAKDNYFIVSKSQSLASEQFRQVHLRVYFSQIYLTDNYITLHLDNLRKLSQYPLIIIGGILKSEDQQYQGKPYENKNVEAYFDLNTKSILLKEEINIYTYTLETKKRDSVFFLEFMLTNLQRQIIKLGKLQFNINSNLNQISQLIINNKSKQKTAFIQAIIDKQPIKDLPRLIPPNVIIDQKVRIPAVKLIQMKNRRQPILLDMRSKMKILGLKVIIKNIDKLEQKIQRNNPFVSSHHENVQITSIIYKLQFGSHNSWKFIDMKDETNIIVLNQPKIITKSKQNQLQLVSDFQKGYFNKTYFQSQNCVFAALLFAQIVYTYEGFVQKMSENLGWCIVVNKLYQPNVKFQSFLESHHSFPGQQINISHGGIKLSVQIDNPDHKYYRKKVQDNFPKQSPFDDIFIDDQAKNLTKTIFVKRQVTQRSSQIGRLGTSKEMDDTEKQLQELINEVESEIKKIKRKITVDGYFIHAQPKSLRVNQQRTYQNLVKFQSKNIRFTIKLISMIPSTDDITYRRGAYYLPLCFRVKLHMLRKSLQIQGRFVDDRSSWNVPVFIKSRKEYNFVQVMIKDSVQLRKVVDSEMLVSVWDVESENFYGKGSVRMRDILLCQQKQVNNNRLQINLTHGDSNMGILVIECSYTLRKLNTGFNKREVQPIHKQAIIQSLPMRERLMMRISNYNNSTSQMQNTAITYYKQKTTPQLVSQIAALLDTTNCSTIQYSLGQSSYHLIQFTNTSQSQNNMFTFLIRDCQFAEIVIDQDQYKLAIIDNDFTAIPYCKMEVGYGETRNQDIGKSFFIIYIGRRLKRYEARIGYKQVVGVLVKIVMMQWSPKHKQQMNFHLDIYRNTIPVITHNFKLLFTPPIIHSTHILYQINTNLSKGITIHLPSQLTTNYKQLCSFSSNFIIMYKPKLLVKLFMKEMVKSPHKLEFLVQGKRRVAEVKQGIIIQNILIQVNLIDGQFVEVQFANLCTTHFTIDTNSNPYLLNQILILPDKSITRFITFTSSVFIISNQNNIVELTICSFYTDLQNIVINFYDLKGRVQYKFLLKLITKIRLQPSVISVENFVGQKIILQCVNPYVSVSQFTIISTSINSIRFYFQTLLLQPHCSQKIVFELIDKLYEDTYISIYDECFTLTQLFYIQSHAQQQEEFNLIQMEKE